MRGDVLGELLHYESVHHSRLLVRRLRFESAVELEGMASRAVTLIIDRLHGRRTMTVDALQVNRTARTPEPRFKMHRVVQFHGARIWAAGSQNSEFRMCSIEPADMFGEGWRHMPILDG